MKKLTFYISSIALIVFAVIMISITSCKKREQVVTPSVPGNEFLTTVIFQCINTVTPFDTTTAIWRQLDPSGTALPDTSHAVLTYHHASTYNCKVYILDESHTATAQLASNTPYNFNITKIPSATGNITDEIRARQNYHLMCYTMTGAVMTNLAVTRTDYDTNSPPLQVGLTDNITTINASTGRMEAVLHHQPNVKNGNCGPGSEDFDVFYTVNINK